MDEEKFISEYENLEIDNIIDILKENDIVVQDAPKDKVGKELINQYPVYRLVGRLLESRDRPFSEMTSYFLSFFKENPPTSYNKYKKWIGKIRFSHWEDELISFIKEIYPLFEEHMDLASTCKKLLANSTYHNFNFIIKFYFWIYFLFIENRRNGISYNFIQFITYVYTNSNVSTTVAIHVSELIEFIIEEYPQCEEPIKKYYHLAKRDLDVLLPIKIQKKLSPYRDEENTTTTLKLLCFDDEDSDSDTNEHFNLPLKGTQVEYLYNELKGIYISNHTNFDLFCYRLIGKKKPQKLEKITWKKGKETLAVFIGLLTDNHRKWVLTKSIFDLPKEENDNFAVYYTRYNCSLQSKNKNLKKGKRELQKIETIVQNCMEEKF